MNKLLVVLLITGSFSAFATEYRCEVRSAASIPLTDNNEKYLLDTLEENVSTRAIECAHDKCIADNRDCSIADTIVVEKRIFMHLIGYVTSVAYAVPKNNTHNSNQSQTGNSSRPVDSYITIDKYVSFYNNGLGNGSNPDCLMEYFLTSVRLKGNKSDVVKQCETLARWRTSDEVRYFSSNNTCKSVDDVAIGEPIFHECLRAAGHGLYQGLPTEYER